MNDSLLYSSFRAFLRGFFAVSGCIVSLFLFSTIIGVIVICCSSNCKVKEELVPSILINGNGEIVPLSKEVPIILEIRVTSKCLLGKMLSDDIRSLLSSAFNGSKFDHGKIKAIFLNIDSGGGSSREGSEIFEALRLWKNKYNVPVYTFVSGMCCSAAFKIACVSDKIFCSKSAMVGSIGVMLIGCDLSALLKKIGVNPLVFSKGSYKTDLFPLVPFDKASTDRLEPLLEEIYDDMINTISSCRSIQENRLRNDIGAKMFGAKQALEIGLLDQVCDSREEALEHISTSLGLSNYSVINMVGKKSLSSHICGSIFEWCAFRLIGRGYYLV